MANAIFRVFSEHLGGTSRADFIGNEGDIFYDPDIQALWISNGVTPGGLPLTGGNSAPYTLPVATTTTLGGVKIDGTSITINSGVISATGGSSINLDSVASNIIPSANGTYTLGNSTVAWKSLYVAANTIYFDDVPFSVLANGQIVTGSNIEYTTANSLNASFANLITAGNNVTASFDANTNQWVISSTSGGGFTNGQSILVNQLTVNTVLANGSVGTAGQFLTSNGTHAYWSTAASGGFSNGQSISVDTLTVNAIVSPGNVSVQPENTIGAALRGHNISINGGTATDNTAGSTTIRGGQSINQVGGATVIAGGSGFTGGGLASLSGGSASGGTGGSVLIDAGFGTSGIGVVDIGINVTNTVNIGRSGGVTTVNLIGTVKANFSNVVTQNTFANSTVHGSVVVDGVTIVANATGGISANVSGGGGVANGANVNFNELIVNTLQSNNGVTLSNNKKINFETLNSTAFASLGQQSDDNLVLYSTNTTGGQRPIWSVFANSDTSVFNINAPLESGVANINALTVKSVSANGGVGNAGQVLTSDGANVYWSTAAGGGGVANGANVNFNEGVFDILTVNSAIYTGFEATINADERLNIYGGTDGLYLYGNAAIGANNGGDVGINGGSGRNAGFFGGDVVISAGSGISGGDAGTVRVRGAQQTSSGNGGNVTLFGGVSWPANGGHVYIQGGAANNGNHGDVYIGNANTTNVIIGTNGVNVALTGNVTINGAVPAAGLANGANVNFNQLTVSTLVVNTAITARQDFDLDIQPSISTNLVGTNLNLTAGDSNTSSNGSGGQARLVGGYGSGADGQGGAVIIAGGDAFNGIVGFVQISGGQSGNDSVIAGNVYISGGYSNGGNHGSVLIGSGETKSVLIGGNTQTNTVIGVDGTYGIKVSNNRVSVYTDQSNLGIIELGYSNTSQTSNTIVYSDNMRVETTFNVPAYTATQWQGFSGAVGSMGAVTDAQGQLCYWNTTLNQYAYVANNAPV